MPNLLARIAVCLSVVGPWPAAAQNLLPNPEVNVNTDFWDNGIYPGSIGWYPGDSRDCPGSGVLVVQCFAVSEIVSTCVPYSAQPIFAGFDVMATEDLGPEARAHILIEMFDDAECESFIDGWEQLYDGVTTEFRRFETDNETPPSTQSVRLRLRVESAYCDVKVSEELLFFDTFYLGTSERIVAHDFESGESCPLTVAD